MSNSSKTGQQEEGHADPSESNLLVKMASEDMIEVSERTNRVKEETSRRDPQTRGIAEDGDLLQTEGVSEPSKVANSNEGMPASREVMSAANTIDDQEESYGEVIEVNRELEEGLLSVVEIDSKLVASSRSHEEGEGFWQEGEGADDAGRRERMAGERMDERITSLGKSKLSREEREDVYEGVGANKMVNRERDELEGRAPILSQLQRNVEDPRNYTGDPTPSEDAKGTEISIEKKEEVSRMVSQDANAEWVERGPRGGYHTQVLPQEGSFSEGDVVSLPLQVASTSEDMKLNTSSEETALDTKAEGVERVTGKNGIGVKEMPHVASHATPMHVKRTQKMNPEEGEKSVWRRLIYFRLTP
ncbi:hypothetical protein TrCOL_g9989 [Triparma columacea]|uniref:Uncharacterized protein n=1 Tax=Triparma columacea TaxID=722753 RepID=A0A9W7G047_9STRA|nr:hypothetical protein TrCOL_g9989 [Triparma columacea]